LNKDIFRPSAKNWYKQVCRSSLLSDQNVNWPRRMLSPGELWWVCRREIQTDGRTPDRYNTLFATNAASVTKLLSAIWRLQLSARHSCHDSNDDGVTLGLPQKTSSK